MLNVLTNCISIHALRVEGDTALLRLWICRKTISIHALRVEGDSRDASCLCLRKYFYPRPPGGGRRPDRVSGCRSQCISIHALRVEGDGFVVKQFAVSFKISIHALRVEGDEAGHKRRWKKQYFYPRPPGGGRRLSSITMSFISCNFYPRPPGGGRQQKRTKFSSVFAKKGEEFASLRRGKRKICRWRFKKDKFWVLIWCEGSRKSVCALASHCG